MCTSEHASSLTGVAPTIHPAFSTNTSNTISVYFGVNGIGYMWHNTANVEIGFPHLKDTSGIPEN